MGPGSRFSLAAGADAYDGVFGSLSSDLDSFEGFNEGRVLGSHGIVRAPSLTEFRRRRGLGAR